MLSVLSVLVYTCAGVYYIPKDLRQNGALSVTIASPHIRDYSRLVCNSHSVATKSVLMRRERGTWSARPRTDRLPPSPLGRCPLTYSGAYSVARRAFSRASSTSPNFRRACARLLQRSAARAGSSDRGGGVASRDYPRGPCWIAWLWGEGD